MLKLGVIGTGWITDSFVGGALRTEAYTLTAVYSRSMERAKRFSAEHGGACCFDDLSLFAASNIDVVYVASPNSMHYAQVMAMLRAKKHVIVEKPAFSNEAEAVSAFSAARDNGVLLFEAARHIHEANFKLVKDLLTQIGELRGASMTFMKYSSRYDDVLKGGEPNIFTLKYSGGALMDIGIYPIYTAVALFGEPKECHYICQKVRTGVDGLGIIIFRYPGCDVVMQCGKTADSFLPSEIYGSTKTISLASMNYIDSIKVFDRASGSWKECASPRCEHWLEEEARCFAGLIRDMDDGAAMREYKSLEELSLTVHKIITKLRINSGIVFDADRLT